LSSNYQKNFDLTSKRSDFDVFDQLRRALISQPGIEDVSSNNVGRHVVEEVLPTCVDCQIQLALLIGGGGAICAISTTHHPFAHSKPALKNNFFLGGINEQKEATATR
jgi:hypothetical protein